MAENEKGLENQEQFEKIQVGDVVLKVAKKKGAKGQPETGASGGLVLCCTITIAAE